MDKEVLIAHVVVNLLLVVAALAVTYFYTALLPAAVGFESTVLIGIAVITMLVLTE